MKKLILGIAILFSVLSYGQNINILLAQSGMKSSTVSEPSLFPEQVDLTSVTWSNYTSPSGGLPSYKTPAYVDPISGFNTYRISDETAFSIGDTYAKRHAYSTRTPFNSDASLILTTSNSGKVIDGSDFDLLGQIDYQIVWSNVTSNIGYAFYGNVFEINTVSMVDYQFTTDFTKTFSDYTVMTMDSNGNVSNNDKYVVLWGRKAANTNLWIVVYDIELDSIVSETDLGGHYQDDIDWAGISQDGSRVFVMYGTDGSGALQGCKSYNRLMADEIHLTNSTHHGDLGVDQSGNQVYVYLGSSAISGYRMGMFNLTTGTGTGLFPDTNGDLWGGHVSCRNILRPGYAYVSMYTDPTATGDAAMMENFSIKLDGSNLIERWGRNNSELAWDGSHYDQQAHGCPSPDGTQFVFASAWGDSTEEAKQYGYLFLTKKD